MNNLNNFNNGRRDAGIMLIKHCPLCNRKYNQENMEMLEEEGNTFLVYFSCENCSSHLIVRVVASPHGLVGTASITDLQANEVLTFRFEKAISANEILDLIDVIKKGNLLNNLYIK